MGSYHAAVGDYNVEELSFWSILNTKKKGQWTTEPNKEDYLLFNFYSMNDSRFRLLVVDFIFLLNYSQSYLYF